MMRVGVTSRTSTSDATVGRGGRFSGSGASAVTRASRVGEARNWWNEASIEKITSPSCTARTCRAEKEPPSRSRSTSKMTGRSTCPGRRK